MSLPANVGLVEVTENTALTLVRDEMGRATVAVHDISPDRVRIRPPPAHHLPIPSGGTATLEPARAHLRRCGVTVS